MTSYELSLNLWDFDVPQDDHIPRVHGNVAVRFPIVVERFDREKFQRECHVVPRMVDEHGRPREWDGPLLFVGLLYLDVNDSYGKLQSRLQVLRVLADTPSELLRLMELRIRETFFSQFTAQSVQSSLAGDVKRLMDENAALRSQSEKSKV